MFGRANAVHHISVKSRRVTRSALAAELLAAIHAFDFVTTLGATLNDIFHDFVPRVLYTDSKFVFYSTVSLSSITEKRLLTDLFILRQCYELRELTEIVRIPSEQNPADAMTKSTALTALFSLLSASKINNWLKSLEWETHFRNAKA